VWALSALHSHLHEKGTERKKDRCGTSLESFQKCLALFFFQGR
jgi:hypothetical protein